MDTRGNKFAWIKDYDNDDRFDWFAGIENGTMDSSSMKNKTRQRKSLDLHYYIIYNRNSFSFKIVEKAQAVDINKKMSVADSVGFVYIIRIIMMDASYKRHDFVGAEICCYRLLIMMNLKSVW